MTRTRLEGVLLVVAGLLCWTLAGCAGQSEPPDSGHDTDCCTTDGIGDPGYQANFEVSCSLPKPDLGTLTEVAFSPNPATTCLPATNDSVTLEHVLVTHLPIDQGTTVYVSGSFQLQSVAAASIRLSVYYGYIENCVGGIAHSPSGRFELWGDMKSITGDPSTLIGVDLAYETTSTDCEYLLSP
jgi:hypothetical protein